MAAGVSAFTIYNHMYMPMSYGDSAEEYSRLTERVALWDVAGERQIEIVVRSDGQLVGELRNAIWSPRLGHGIGVALVSRSATAPGSRLVVDIDGALSSIVIAADPFGTPRRPISSTIP